MRRDHPRISLAVAAVFDRTLEGAERLRPQAVLAPVPEEERAVRHPRDRHSAATGIADAPAERPAVLKLLLREVARGAGHLAVGAQARIEEQLAPERRGSRIVCHPVGWIRGHGPEVAERQAGQ